MRLGVALAALGLAVAGCGKEASERRSDSPSSAPPPSASKPAEPPAKGPKNAILAFTWSSANGDGVLVELEPVSLRRASRRSVELGAWGGTAFAPDGSTLAVGMEALPAVQFVDVAAMRIVGKPFALAGEGSVTSTLWAEPGVVVALVEDPTARARVVAVDPRTRRLIAEQPLDGSVTAVRRTREALVMLLSPRGSIGPARLAVVSARGDVRLARLNQISAGFESVASDQEEEPLSRELVPGLAVDPRGQRAVVVSPDRRAATVNLASLAVSYHELSQPVSLLERLRNWLEPAAHAKLFEGPIRQAVWLGRNYVAVTGVNYRVGKGDHFVETPAGLDLVDTRNWSVRTLDRNVMGITRAGPLLLAFGGQHAKGLTAYGPDGRERFRVLETRHVWFADVAGRYAYAEMGEDDQVRRVIDLRRGRVIGPARNAGPVFLLEGA